MLPAAHGDSLWMTYGEPDRPRHLIIDGGLRYTYDHLRQRILSLPPEHRVVELLVITHVDGDHIEGAIRLMQDSLLDLTIKEIWFNGQPQLDKLDDPAGPALGPEQGEFLGALIRKYEESEGMAVWNTSFERRAVMVPATGALPTVHFDGLELTLIAPSANELLVLKDHWGKVLEEAGLEPGNVDQALARLEGRPELSAPDELGGPDATGEPEDEFDAASFSGDFSDVLGEADRALGSDKTPANGSSIAFLAKHGKHRALLTGDAFAGVLKSGLERVNGGDAVGMDLFKIPHHGSVGNVTEDLLSLIKCRRYLFSTSGKIFGHPHERAVELILENHQGKGRPILAFNYNTERNKKWSDPEDQKARKYLASFPSGLSMEVGG